MDKRMLPAEISDSQLDVFCLMDEKHPESAASECDSNLEGNRSVIFDIAALSAFVKRGKSFFIETLWRPEDKHSIVAVNLKALGCCPIELVKVQRRFREVLVPLQQYKKLCVAMSKEFLELWSFWRASTGGATISDLYVPRKFVNSSASPLCLSRAVQDREGAYIKLLKFLRLPEKAFREKRVGLLSGGRRGSAKLESEGEGSMESTKALQGEMESWQGPIRGSMALLMETVPKMGSKGNVMQE
ncbi:MAG: hypothetical protein Q9217_006548 [Psora testacea]